MNNRLDNHPLPSPNALKKQLPASDEQLAFVEQTRETIRGILTGRDPRLLLIIGPCSIHDMKSAEEYAIRFKALSKMVESHFFMVMRTHVEKPRTGIGWKGLLYDPDLDGSHDISKGLLLARHLFLTLIQLGVPCGTEFLEPLAAPYYSELISWGGIGARTVGSQTHRQLAASLPMPVGFKNGMDGSLEVAAQALLAAAAPHSLLGINDKGQCCIIRSKGNTDTHLVLRGGPKKTNYDPDSIRRALRSLAHASLPQRVMIDCSHDNAQKRHEQQAVVFQSVLRQHIEGNSKIMGMMIESHLVAGNQPFSTPLQYGVSVTDPCLNWAMTETLVLWGHKQLERSKRLEMAKHLH